MASSGSLNTSAYSNRHLTFSWSIKSQSIENNKTTVSWTLKGAGSQTGYYKTRNVKLDINGTTAYSFGGGSSSYISLYNGTEVASGEFVVVHDANGKGDFDVYIEAGIYIWEPNCSGSGSFTLDDIPRASTLVAANGTLGTEQTLTIERAASSFKHRLTYRCGDVAEYIAGSADSYTTATSIKWTPRIGLAAENTTGTSVSVTLTLYTYTSDGTHVGTTTQTITCAIPISVKPSVAISWKDISGVADTYNGNPVQGLSKLEITLTEQTSYSSAIARRSITANGVTYTEATVTTEVLKESGSQEITATVKDQRGRTGSSSASLVVLAYSPPNIFGLSVHRCDADGSENGRGEYVKVTFSADVSTLHAMNPITYKLRYKSSAASDYTEVNLTGLDGVITVRDYEYVFAADGNSSYEVEIVAFDGHNTATRATTASTAFTLMNWNANGTGLGIGKVSERDNAVEFGLDIFDKNEDEVLGVNSLIELFYPVGSITLRYDHTNPGTIYGGTWTRISSYVLRGATASDTIGSTGTLADGSGRTYVNISIWRRTA